MSKKTSKKKSALKLPQPQNPEADVRIFFKFSKLAPETRTIREELQLTVNSILPIIGSIVQRCKYIYFESKKTQNRCSVAWKRRIERNYKHRYHQLHTRGMQHILLIFKRWGRQRFEQFSEKLFCYLKIRRQSSELIAASNADDFCWSDFQLWIGWFFHTYTAHSKNKTSVNDPQNCWTVYRVPQSRTVKTSRLCAMVCNMNIIRKLLSDSLYNKLSFVMKSKIKNVKNATFNSLTAKRRIQPRKKTTEEFEKNEFSVRLGIYKVQTSLWCMCCNWGSQGIKMRSLDPDKNGNKIDEKKQAIENSTNADKKRKINATENISKNKHFKKK